MDEKKIALIRIFLIIYAIMIFIYRTFIWYVPLNMIFVQANYSIFDYAMYSF